KFVKKDVAGYTPEERKELQDAIAALSAEAHLKAQRVKDAHDAAEIENGRKLIASDLRCTDCHQFRKKDEDADAPDLTGYGSREWLTKFLDNPAHPDFYGKLNDRMPAFGEEKILSAQQVQLVADWLRGEWYEPGETAAVTAEK
ncbi:MAG TPA: c-type cytochrome, partial [Verrucomicrobiae bacterium]|nr:c-type cytochrome [Verrucomicrobiae bacterium]